MPTRSLALTTAMLLPLALPAVAQQQPGADFPGAPESKWSSNLCGGCHDINRLKIGYTPEGWRTVMRMMQNMEVAGSEGSGRDRHRVSDQGFPERPRPAANIIDGPVQVSIKQWPVPTPGSRPHDPRATTDGSIWYTGQLAGVLGRLDPEHRPDQGIPAQDAAHRPARPCRGQGRQHLVHRQQHRHHRQARSEDRRSHGISAARSEARRSAHAQLRPERHPVVHRAAGQHRRPARPEDRRDQARHPADAESRPYGIVINSKGIPLFVEFGTNKVATIDPKTMAIKEYTLPDPAARPRRLALEADDVVWYADFARAISAGSI